MALTELTADLNIHQSKPNKVRGEASATKAYFDKAANDTKDYINDSLIPEIEDQFETKDNITTIRKLSASGDFSGTWNGHEMVETDPGIQSIVDDIVKYGSHDVTALELVNFIVPSEREYTINNVATLSYLGNNANAELYFPSGKYHLLSGLQFLYGVSIRLHKNAEIIADVEMSYMFDFNNVIPTPSSISTYKRHQYISGGTINGNDKADICIKASKFQDFIIKDVLIKNSLKRGILSEELAAELKVDNVYLCNDNYLVGAIDNVTDNIAIDIQSTDNYIHNVTIVDYSTGIRIGKAANYADKVHFWTSQGDRIPHTIGFDVMDESWCKFSYCVADTAQIGFRNARVMWLDHCHVVNNSFFASCFSATPTAIHLDASTYDFISVTDCTFEDQGEGLTLNILNISPSSAKTKNITGNIYWGTVYNKILENYEMSAASFTPTVSGSTVSGTHTYTNRNALYTRIGKTVNFSINVKCTLDSTISGNLIITGLPYASTSIHTGLSIGYNSNLGEQTIYAGITASSSNVTLYAVNESKAISQINSVSLRGLTIEIWVSGSYLVP